MPQLKVQHQYPAEYLVRLKPHKLGRYYHLIPQYIRELHSKHPQAISDYFLSKYHINVDLTAVEVHEQLELKPQCTYRCHYGKVGFSIERGLISEALESFYGGHYQPHQDLPESVSEQRLRSRIGMDAVQIFARALLSGHSFGELKPFDQAYSELSWEYIAELKFHSHTSEQNSSLFIYLDTQLVDVLTDRMNGPTLAPTPVNSFDLIHQLPVKLNCVVAKAQLPLHEVLALRPGDILSIRMDERCDIEVNRQKLFKGALFEDEGALYLTSIERANYHD